jgi:putative transposase
MDDKGRDVIPESVKLVAGRTGQEYNIRKNRKGAFWEDRYHATAIESKHHLLRCLSYIDLNMVRNGVVSHPSEWSFGGYNEIQHPRKKCVLIAYQKLAELTGFEPYDAFRKVHKEVVEESLRNGDNTRQPQWTESIAVGSRNFVETIKEDVGVLAKGRKIMENDGITQLREEEGIYIVNSGGKKNDIGAKNIYLWDISC